MPTEKGWAIAYEGGLYTGWWGSRRSAIVNHVSELCSHTGEFGQISPYAYGGRLDDEQLRAWKYCKKRGDRTVKVKITYRYTR
jgi:hypothetical protein